MKLRRRGLVVILSAETPKDDRQLAHFAKRYNRPLNAGFGRHSLSLELPEDVVMLSKLLRYIWGEDGRRKMARLVQVITAAHKEKK